MPNRLIDETSPYLLQHAHNPVDWYPWGEEALGRAAAEDRPILLSIGYSACHWCHVMERESFENEDIAALMNEHFVNIKVDREERPDLDSIYMEAVQAMTGSGGWPLTVFLTPERLPYYGGTYFPPEDRGRMPGFPRLLSAGIQAYRTNKGEIEQVTRQLVEQISRVGQALLRGSGGFTPLTTEPMHQAYSQLATQFDHLNGGFGNAPKFPQPTTPEFLLRYYRHGFNDRALEMVELTLQKMAGGGMYDQIGGGFHRYATDAYWLVPHFEKMLYDNALLSRLYLHAWQVTGQPLYRRIAEETLDYVLREMTDPSGAFYSAQDADSEGVEGKFFVWRPAELRSLLGDDADLVMGYYGVTARGNFEGANILNTPRPAADCAAQRGVSEAELLAAVERARATLLAARERRVHPLLDDKALTAWNGLMLRSCAEAAAALGRADYRDAARRNAAFLLDNMRDGNGRILRTWRNGQARLPGYLEDYACLADGLLALHEATLEPRWLQEAVRVADEMIALFWDDGVGGFYDTGVDHETLVIRPRDMFDNAQPCGGSVAADVLLRLAVITGNDDYRAKGVAPLRDLQSLLGRAPGAMGHWLGVLDFYVSLPKEIALAGPAEHPAMQAMRAEIGRRYLPNRVVVGMADPGHPPLPASPLLEQRGLIDGAPAAYVCEHYACRLPVTDAAGLAAQLDG